MIGSTDLIHQLKCVRWSPRLVGRLRIVHSIMSEKSDQDDRHLSEYTEMNAFVERYGARQQPSTHIARKEPVVEYLLGNTIAGRNGLKISTSR